MISLDNNLQTLGDLAKHYKKNEQAIRRAFKRMVRANQLEFDKDYIKSGYKDEKHFVYLVNPQRFHEYYQETIIGRPAILGDLENEIKGSAETPVADIESDNSLNHTDIKKPARAISAETHGDIKDDYIATLKTQLEMKDGQIQALQDSLKTKDDLVVALNTQLLRLTEGKKTDIKDQESNIRYEPIDNDKA